MQHGIGKVFSDHDFDKKNADFINEFKHNTAVFAAFKNHRQTKEMVELLHDEDGNLRSFREFRKLAEGISKDYNRNWLQTEYNTAVRAARTAANYRKYLETEHLYPNLEYIKTSASHPRDSHLDYVGTILPIRHEWWDTHMPPSDWNCACSVRPTDKEATAVPDGDYVNPVFQNNPGKSAEFVKLKEHSYVKDICPNFKGCGDNTETQLSDNGDKELCRKICEVAKRFRRKQKDKEIREWAQRHIPAYGVTIEKRNFATGKIMVSKRAIKSVAGHFTELHLKELAKDIFEIIDKAQLLSTADLNPNSPNYESKVRRGVTGYKYYKLFHKGLNLRLNTEVINGKEQVYSLNIIKQTP